MSTMRWSITAVVLSLLGTCHCTTTSDFSNVKLNFTVVGFPKCGTTMMVFKLRAYPMIHIDTEEMNFFNKKLANRDLPKYKKALETTTPFVGEKSHYIYAAKAMEELSHTFPRVKIIVAMRQPVKMVNSYYEECMRSYSTSVRNAREAKMNARLHHLYPIPALIPTIEDILLHGKDLVRFSIRNVDFANMIAHNLAPFFEPTRVHFQLLEAVQAECVSEMGRLMRFIGVDALGVDVMCRDVHPEKDLRGTALRALPPVTAQGVMAFEKENIVEPLLHMSFIPRVTKQQIKRYWVSGGWSAGNNTNNIPYGLESRQGGKKTTTPRRTPSIPLIRGGGGAKNRMPEKNVILIVCDDLNTDLGFYGQHYVHTPSLDQFASESMVFENAYCQFPVCGPSRGSFMSGLYPETTRIFDNFQDIRVNVPNAPSIPYAFQSQGYWTVFVGPKLYHPERSPYEFDPGFIAWNTTIHRPQKWYTEMRHLSKELRDEKHPGHAASGLRDDQYADMKAAHAIVDFLDDREVNGTTSHAPFFIGWGIGKPHVPFHAPDHYFHLYPEDEVAVSLPPVTDWAHRPSSAGQPDRAKAFGFMPYMSPGAVAKIRVGDRAQMDLRLQRAYKRAYYACVSFVDTIIGVVLDRLRSSEALWDTTTVVLTADHGYILGDHYAWGKNMLFEKSARVPLVIRSPGVTPANGARNSKLVESVDIFPTLMDLAGLQARAELQGRSYKRVLQKDLTYEHRTSAYTVAMRGGNRTSTALAILGRAIRTDRWRYVEWDCRQTVACMPELYDMRNDPMERYNLADPHYQAQIEKFDRRLSPRSLRDEITSLHSMLQKRAADAAAGRIVYTDSL